MLGWLADPIFGSGDYPPAVLDLITSNTFQYKDQQLPEELPILKGKHSKHNCALYIINFFQSYKD